MVDMAGRKLELGATGAALADNLSRLRQERGFNYTDLSNRLAARNRDIPPLAIRRIEEGNRRVDVDDLMALAFALGVSPISLLLPGMPEARDPALVSVTGLHHDVLPAELWEYLAANDKALPLWITVSRPQFMALGVPYWKWDRWSKDADGHDQ